VDFHEAESLGLPKEKMIRIFKEICKYAEFHFLSEENLMIDNLYLNKNNTPIPTENYWQRPITNSTNYNRTA